MHTMTPEALNDRTSAVGRRVRWEIDPYRLTSEVLRRTPATSPEDAAALLAVPLGRQTNRVARWLDPSRPAAVTLETAWAIVDALNGATTLAGHLVVTGWGAGLPHLEPSDILVRPWWARR